MLVKRKDDLAKGSPRSAQFLPSLSEASASGPYFKVVLHNLALPDRCSRSSTRRSRSAASTRRTSGAAPGCRRTGGPTPTAPASPTARRRRRRRCWRAPRSIRGRPSRPGRRAPTPRRIRGNVTIGDEGLPRPGNPLPCAGSDRRPVRWPRLPRAGRRCDVAAGPQRSAAHAGHPDRRTPGGPPPNVPGTPVPLPDAPPGARTVPVPPAPFSLPPGFPPGPPAHPGPGRSCRPRSSIQVDRG